LLLASIGLAVDNDRFKSIPFTPKKVLLVTDDYLSSLESGPVQIVGDYFKKAGLEYVVFDGVTPNFKDKDVYAGLEIYEKETLKYLKTRLFRVNSTIRPEAGIKT
jgi:alcohol dehydrogenase YqhD (iron-dependent ADH family)